MHPGSRRSKGDRTSRRRPSARYELTIDVSDNALLACGGWSYPDLEISGRGGGGSLQTNAFRPSESQFGLKIRGGQPAPPLDPPLDFVREGKERDKFLQGSFGQTAARESRILV